MRLSIDEIVNPASSEDSYSLELGISGILVLLTLFLEPDQPMTGGTTLLPIEVYGEGHR